MSQLRENPVIPLENDEVGRRIDESLEKAAFERMRDWSVGELREFILSPTTGSDQISVIRWGVKWRDGGRSDQAHVEYGSCCRS